MMATEKSPEPRPEDAAKLPAAGARRALQRLEEHNARQMEAERQTGASEPGRSFGGLARFTAMGFEFFGVLLIFGLIGQWLDKTFHWPDIATVVAITIAFIGEMYLQIKTLLRKKK